MGIDLYYMPLSSPCRSIMLTARALGVELNLINTNLQTGDHLKPDFIKMNPQHTIPTLNDDGFPVWESRAVCAYLVNQYGKDDALYPKEPKKRVVVDQRLYFDMGVLYQRFADVYYPLFKGPGKIAEDKMGALDEAFAFLNIFLEGKEWAAGDQMTIADFALVTSVSSIDAVGYDFSKHSNVVAWYNRCKNSIEGYEELNQKGTDEFGEWIKDLINKK